MHHLRTLVLLALATASAAALLPNAAAQQPAGVDLNVTKTDSADPVTVGQQFTFTLTVTNEGTVRATGTRLVDTLPSEVTLVSASAGCTRSGQTVTCNAGNLNAGASATFTITVEATTAGTATNTVTASANQADVDGSDNSDSETTTIRPQSPGPLVCTAGPDGVRIDFADVPQATSYNIFRASGATGTASFVFLDSTTQSEYLDTTAAVGQAYRYRVTAVANGVESEPSAPCIITSVPEFPGLVLGAIGLVGAIGAMRVMRRR